MEEPRHKRTNVCFQLHEVPRTGIVIETESRLVVASTWGEEEMGRYGSKAPTQEDEKFLVVDGGVGRTTLLMC